MAAPHNSPPSGRALSPLDQAKAAARRQAQAARAGLDPVAAGQALTTHVLAGHVLAGHVLQSDAPAQPPAWAGPPRDAVVGGFWPIGTEIDIRPLLLALIGRGHAVVLPATPPRGQPLTFHRWTPGAAMIAERFGTKRPDGPVLVPDFLLVPLLAFDRAGRRLGYGGGYYDRTLALLPGVATLGCAFAAQELAELPAGPYDARLQAVATERGIIRCEG